jgi:putative hydrolase of the HAD superfamily
MIIEYNTIFFDLFGVLIGRDETSIVRYVSKVLDIPFYQTREVVTGENYMRFVRQEISFDQYFQKLQFQLVNGDKLSRGEFLSRLQQQEMGILPIANLLPGLKKQFNLHIISNTVNSHINSLKMKFEFFKYFDSVITSESAGAPKPDDEIFKYALSITGSIANSSIFVDDASKNVTSAIRNGLHGYHYTQFEDFENYISKLMIDTSS